MTLTSYFSLQTKPFDSSAICTSLKSSNGLELRRRRERKNLRGRRGRQFESHHSLKFKTKIKCLARFTKTSIVCAHIGGILRISCALHRILALKTIGKYMVEPVF